MNLVYFLYMVVNVISELYIENEIKFVFLMEEII